MSRPSAPKRKASDAPLVTLDDLNKYARVHQHIEDQHGNDVWTLDRSHVLNRDLASAPIERFFWSSGAEVEDAADIHLQVDGQDCGTLAAPTVERLLALGKPAGFGRGSTTVYDETVRQALAIDGNRIRLGTMAYDDVLQPFDGDDVFPDALADWFYGPHHQGDEFRRQSPAPLTLYKLHLYPVGGHFDWHVDTPHADRHLATAIVQLGTAFAGGGLVVKHAGAEDGLPADNKAGECTAAAWFVDCEHKVERVTSGVRIVLQYDMIVDRLGEESPRRGDTESSWDQSDGGETPHPRVVRQLPAYLAKVVAHVKDQVLTNRVALLLQHRYLGTDDGLSLDALKGMDAELAAGLRAGLPETLILTVRPCVIDHMHYDRAWTTWTVRDPLMPRGPPSATRTVLYPGRGLQHALQLRHHAGAEHTGNEAMPAETRYLSAALVVRHAPSAPGHVDE